MQIYPPSILAGGSAVGVAAETTFALDGQLAEVLTIPSEMVIGDYVMQVNAMRLMVKSGP